MTMRGALLVVTLVAMASLVLGSGCLDENGKPVDWFMSLKGPQIKESKDPRIQAGTMYQYGDANTFKTAQGFKVSPNKLDGPNAALARTIQQTYAAAASAATAKEQLYVFYNDEVPNGKTCDAELAHSKGVLSLDATSKTGYWIIHSMPNVADPPTAGHAPTFKIPDSAVIYGQSILCMSIDLPTANSILKQFQYHNPNVYASNFPSELGASMKDATAFFAGARIKTAGAPGLSQVTLTTRGGQAFTHFGKSREWGMDLYRDAIAAHYNAPFAVETWMRPLEPSYAPPKSKYYVVNVQSTSMEAHGPASPLTWTEEEDHSKWAVSLSGSPVVCIGDINKQQSQWGRGGGSACIQNANVHAAFVKIVGMVDKYVPAGTIPSGGAIPLSTAAASKGGKVATPAPAPAPAPAPKPNAKPSTKPKKTTTTTTTTETKPAPAADTTTTTKKPRTKKPTETTTTTTTAKKPRGSSALTADTTATPVKKPKRTPKATVAKMRAVASSLLERQGSVRARRALRRATQRGQLRPAF